MTTEPLLLITTGPESCGKTTLAQALSDYLHAPLVSEASRPWLQRQLAQNEAYRYTQADLTAIATEQDALETTARQQQAPYLACDTDLLVILVWSEVKYGTVDPAITERFHRALATTRRRYLLCDYHIPWESDPLRENPHDRAQLFERYLAKLTHYGLDYRIVTGSVSERVAQTLAVTDRGGGCPCCID